MLAAETAIIGRHPVNTGTAEATKNNGIIRIAAPPFDERLSRKPADGDAF